VKKGSIFMPAGLFSLYIGCMALWEKNPENNRSEQVLLWAVKLTGVVLIVSGARGLYIYYSTVTSQEVYLGWAILSIAKSISKMFLGAGFLVYYKKSLNVFTRYWIFIPLMIYSSADFLRDLTYYEPTMLRITSEVLSVFLFLFCIFYWFYFKIKHPEEFGLKS
jgi:hypothetical protein